MIKTLKTFAIAMLATGATVTATEAATKTNVVENIAVNLTIYQQYVPGASTYGTAAVGGTNATDLKLYDHQSTLNTKDIIAGLSAATGTNFSSMKSPALVLVTTYSNVVVSNLPLVTNLSASTNPVVIASDTNNNLTITIGGQNVPTNTIVSTNILVTNTVLYLGSLTNPVVGINTNTIIVFSNGTALSTNTFLTNSGEFVTISASPTNASGAITNLNILTEEGTPQNLFGQSGSTTVDVLTGTGSASSPYVYNDVSRFVSGGASDTIQQGIDKISFTNSTSTNPAAYPLFITNLTSQSAVGIASYSFRFFTTTQSGLGSNLSLSVSGFAKDTLKVDTLMSHGTNKTIEQIFNSSSTATVAGTGYIDGQYAPTNASGYNGSVSLPVSEYPVAGATGFITNGSGYVSGSLTNTVPIVATGTVDVTFLKNVAQ